MLEDIRDRKISVDDALTKLKLMPIDELDLQPSIPQKIRQGVSEVIYGGKFPSK